MRRMTPQELDAFKRVATHNQDLLKYLDEWYTSELDTLVKTKDNTAQQQGRCQVLQELRANFASSIPSK